MSIAPLSPVMLTAADGLLKDQGLDVNSELIQALGNYNSTPTVSVYTAVLTNAIALIGIAQNNVFPGTIAAMQALGDGILPSVTNAVTSQYTSQIGSVPVTFAGGLSGLVLQQANRIMGDGDLSRFIQIFGIAQGYTFLVNQFINSAQQASTLSSTFTDMNSLSSGAVSELTDDLDSLADDIIKLGQAWDMNSLEYLGYPWMLLRQLSLNGGLLPGFVEKLLRAGVDITRLIEIAQGTQPPTAQINAGIYRAFKSITGNELQEAKILLEVTTEGLTSLADLLDPKMALPNSYKMLQYRIFSGANSSELTTIYSQTDTVNSSLLPQFADDTVYQDLAKVIPADQALASRALSQTLQQIKNIFIPDTARFANAIKQVETFEDLPAIDSLAEPVPASVISSITNILGNGTGSNGTVTLFDILGSAAGIPYTEQYQTMTGTINSLDSAGEFVPLIDPDDGVFIVMFNVLIGTYDNVETVVDEETGEETEEFTVVIPFGLPGAGTYSSYSAALSIGLIPAAESVLTDIVNNNPTAASTLNASSSDVVSSLASEIQFQQAAQIDFDDLASDSDVSVLSFASSLHNVGTDTGETGRAVYFEKIAERNNIYGQAIIAAMREGRNISALNSASIQLDTQIPLR